MRLKKSFSTARDAWSDIASKLNIKPSEVTAKHSDKAWIWIPKKSSKFTLLKPGETKSGKMVKPNSKKKKSSKKSSKTKIKKLTKDLNLCSNIKSALNDPQVGEIIIKKR